MINLRYHIVSITAVFLALGIGIAMGGAFLNDLTLEQIDKNVRSAREEARRVADENDQLRQALERSESRSSDFTDEGVERLFDGRLPDLPVLVIASAGVDSDSLDRMRTALASAGPGFEGTLVATERLRLDDDGAAEDLAELLDAASTDPEQLQRLVASRLAGVLTSASEPAPEDDGPGTTTTASTSPPATQPDGTPVVTEPATTGPGTTTTTLPERDVTPELVTGLIERGFLDYERAPGGPEADAILRAFGYRYVVVTGPEPDLPDEDLVLPLLRAMTADAPAPVVVASAATGDDPEAVRLAAIGPIRDDDQIAGRVSTVDDMETLSGIAAVILGLEDLGRDVRGHYGVAEGARSQLPPPLSD